MSIRSDRVLVAPAVISYVPVAGVASGFPLIGTVAAGQTFMPVGSGYSLFRVPLICRWKCNDNEQVSGDYGKLRVSDRKLNTSASCRGHY